MEGNKMNIKDYFIAALAFCGAGIAQLFGGWSAGLTTLVVFMCVDYATGIIVAGIFKKSSKTKSGALESRAGWYGICRKVISLLMVLVACRLDLIIGSDYIRDAAVIAFTVNETISIVENAGLMGIPIPAVIKKAVEILREKSDDTKH